jgi:hypothetical protein
MLYVLFIIYCFFTTRTVFELASVLLQVHFLSCCIVIVTLNKTLCFWWLIITVEYRVYKYGKAIMWGGGLWVLQAVVFLGGDVRVKLDHEY